MQGPIFRVRERWLRIVDRIHGLKDGERASLIDEIMGKTGSDAEKLAIAMELSIAAGWYSSGRQSVQLSHTLAASLIATDTPEDPPPLPWPSFELQVPSGLLATSKEQIHSIVMAPLPSYLCVEGSQPLHALLMLWDQRESYGVFDATTPQADVNKVSFENEALANDPEGIRVFLMARRLFFNTCFALAAHRSGGEDPQFCTNTKKTKAGINTHVLTPTRPLALRLKEVVQEVRSYIRGERSEVRVSTLVRGHWRNQPYGEGASLRKRLWIRPFYRGKGHLVDRPIYLFGEAPNLETTNEQQAAG